MQRSGHGARPPAAVFLGLSLFVDGLQDLFGERLGPWRILFEDGFKLLGAAGWLGYFTTTGSRALRLSFAAPFRRGAAPSREPAVTA